ncbi:MAG: DNA gyrase inhibitor YacG [Chromatiales bacterium]|nr:DNA gyrase inhibitor YacG [Chromatiales bacterium]
MSSTIVVNCPTCQTQVEWSEESPFRPFCSERCRLIDLGEWADEWHHIPGDHHQPLERDEGFNDW